MGASRPQTPRCFLVLDYLFSSTRKLQFYVELAILGCGLYRDVNHIVTDKKLYFPRHSLFIRTENNKKDPNLPFNDWGDSIHILYFVDVYSSRFIALKSDGFIPVLALNLEEK